MLRVGANYDIMTAQADKIPVGCDRLVYLPYLMGERTPHLDPDCRGVFFGISAMHTRAHFIRAVLEGVCYHLRWFIETQDKKIKTSDTIRFVGGGALSSLTCQILADCTGRTIETTESPQNAGSVGAAITAAVGLGVIENMEQAKSLIKANATYKPNPANKAVYDKNFEVFKQLYKANKKNFSMLNG